jgi:Flp pilus assembly protein TadD
LPWLLAAVLIGWLTVVLRQHSLISDTTATFPWFNLVTLWHYALLRQLSCLFWPFAGQLFYHQPFLVYQPAPWFYYTVNCLTPLFGLLFYWFRRQRQIIFYLAWFLINIGLSISITPFIEFPASDRYNYLSLLALAWPLAIWLNRQRRRLLILVILLVAFAWSVNQLNLNWHNDLTFWQAAVRQQPQSYQAHYNLAITLYEQGQLAAALTSINQAAALAPNHPNIANYQGFLLTMDGRQLALAEQLLHKSLTLNSRQALPHINLSRLAIIKQDWAQARRQLDLAAKLITNEPRANYDLWYQSAFVAMQQRQPQRAEQDSRLALSFMPQEADALYINGLANLELNRLDQACSSLRQAAALGQPYAEQLKLDLCR